MGFLPEVNGEKMTNWDKRMSRNSSFNDTLGIIKEDGLKLNIYRGIGSSSDPWKKSSGLEQSHNGSRDGINRLKLESLEFKKFIWI